MDKYTYGYDYEDLLNKLLEFCIDQNKEIYNLNEFRKVDSLKKNFPTTILNVLANAKSLFDVDQYIVQISIKVFHL